MSGAERLLLWALAAWTAWLAAQPYGVATWSAAFGAATRERGADERGIQDWAFLAGVDVAQARPRAAVAAFGDSIGDGTNSAVGANCC